MGWRVGKPPFFCVAEYGGDVYAAVRLYLRGDDFPAAPAQIPLVKILRHFFGRSAKQNAPRFGGGNPFRLPLPDIFPFALGHIGQKLQYNVGNERPGQIPVDAGVQQGHIQHTDVRPPGFLL